MSEEIPKAFKAKIVTYLDSEPTFSGPQGTGCRQVTVTLAFLGEVEAPLLLNFNDAKRLVVGVLRGLAHHDDPRAKLILDDFFEGVTMGCGNWVSELPASPMTPLSPVDLMPFLSEPPPISEKSFLDEPPVVNKTSRKPPPELPADYEFPDEDSPRYRTTMRVKTRYGRKVGGFDVVAGFRHGDTILLLCISRLHPKRQQTLMLALPNRQLIRPETVIGKDSWPIYVTKRTGAKLKIGNDGWIKQSLRELHDVIGDRVYVLPQGVCHPREKRNERAEDEF